MSLRTVLFVVVGAILLAGSAWAHHNMTAIFDFNDRVMLSGTLTKVDWRNPHIELVVDAKSGDQVQSWSLEGPPPNHIWLTPQGTDLGFFHLKSFDSPESGRSTPQTSTHVLRPPTRASRSTTWPGRFATSPTLRPR